MPPNKLGDRISPWMGYGFAVVMIVIAAALKAWIEHASKEAHLGGSVLLIFSVITAWQFGPRCGFFALLLSGVVLYFDFAKPFYHFPDPVDYVRLLIFVGTGVLIIALLKQVGQGESALRESEGRLRRLNETLEKRVTERTTELEARSKQLRALALDLADSESRERKRLAQLLHDNFQQLISAAKLKTGIALRSVGEGAAGETLKQINSLLEQAIKTSRSLVTELSPPLLNDAGLMPALQWLARRMERDYGLRVALACDPAAEPADEQMRTLLFECARELLFNVVKHAETHDASVVARVSAEGVLSLTVADHGSGFDARKIDVERAKGEGTFGLISIRERLGFVGGLLNIKSVAGAGTRMEVSVPVGVPAVAAPAAELAVPNHRQPMTEGVVDGRRPTRVVVADDHKLFRDGLIALLSQEPSLVVVGEAADGEQALEVSRKLHPDILILDVTMPKLNGVQVASQLSRELPQTHIVGLSMHEEDDMATAMHSAGAVAYLTKDGPPDVLLGTLRSLAPAR